MEMRYNKPMKTICNNHMRRILIVCSFFIVLELLCGVTDARAATQIPRITGFGNASGGIEIRWGRVDTAVKYHVYRREKGVPGWRLIATTRSTKRKDTGLSSGVTYEYAVTSIGKQGKESRKSPAKRRKYVTSPLISLENRSSGIRISWAAVRGASRYCIYKRQGAGPWTGTTALSSTSFTDKLCDSGNVYKYRVACINASGKQISLKSLEKSRTFVAPPQISLSNEVNGLRITWEEIKGAVSYRVFRKKQTDGTWAKLGETAGLKYTNTRAESGETYSYKVVCLSRSNSPVSAESAVKTKTYVACPVLTVDRKEDGSPGLDIRWNRAEGASSYRLYRMPEGKAWSTVADLTESDYSDTDTISGVTYSYQIASLSDEGKLLSAKSDPVSGMYFEPAVKYTLDNSSTLKPDIQTDDGKIYVPYMTEVLEKDLIKKGRGVWHVLEYQGSTYYMWANEGVTKLSSVRSKFLYRTDNDLQRYLLDLALSFLDIDTKYENGKYCYLNDDGTYCFDCSNFTAYCINEYLNVYKPNGLTTNIDKQYELREGRVLTGTRLVDGQETAVTLFSSDVIPQGEAMDPSLLEPGDLLYWNHKKETKSSGEPRIADHVGLYLGDNEFIHCNSTFNVCVSALKGKYVDDFVGAVRFTAA